MLRRCYIESDYIKREKVGRPGGGERTQDFIFIYMYVYVSVYVCHVYM